MKYISLAARIRPQTIDEIVGQEHLLAQDGILTKTLAGDGMYCMENQELIRQAWLELLQAQKNRIFLSYQWLIQVLKILKNNSK